ncbi:HAUS augmin-like complex subunit 3 isoform X2 [Linepithema humile]|uniref:HAUS augmin-like complex subunit 3 isoform X2 n=1 Tax=Linepithema humile TaxID=83485 RepID=UPI00062318A1|nr:PREDICTED: HAUS augmin-like complex subunit 3 isoform X2 [Linepithema humile]
MSITGKLFYNKIRELRPDLSSGITPEILSKVCDDPSTQPFLEWFCKNVNSANILSNEETKLKNILQDAGEWLEGEALDAELKKYIKDCPDLLQLISLDDISKEDLFIENETLKTSCKEDEEYLNLLKNSIKNLKEVENKLDDNIEEAEIMLHKEQIETEKAYDNCSAILKEFDKDNCQFSKDVDTLLNVYADAAKNQGDAILWSQMPTDLFIKEIELYNHYLSNYIKKQFGSTDKEEEDSSMDSDDATLTNDTTDEKVDKRMHELFLCKTNLTNSKIEEISAKVQEEFSKAMLQCVEDIYNNGILKVPGDDKLQDEIRTLSVERDFLEQNVEILRDQQFPEVIQFAEMETIKILKNDALVRLERRKARLEKLQNLYSLAAKHGHVHIDLLCILMEMQFCCLREVAEFIANARHYITTEYKLSSTRCEIMQQQQDEYENIIKSLRTYNVFNEILISMMHGHNTSNETTLSSALKKYDDLIADNEEKKLMLEMHLNNKIDKLQKLESEVNKDYLAETQSGPTISFRPISYEISTTCEEISTVVQDIQGEITKIRNQFKERMRMGANLEREKDILWQRFLADPDTLRMKYDEAKQKANESHFRDTLENA